MIRVTTTTKGMQWVLWCASKSLLRTEECIPTARVLKSGSSSCQLSGVVLAEEVISHTGTPPSYCGPHPMTGWGRCLQTWSSCSSAGQFWSAIIVWHCPIGWLSLLLRLHHSLTSLCTESIFLSFFSPVVVPRMLLDKMTSY